MIDERALSQRVGAQTAAIHGKSAQPEVRITLDSQRQLQFIADFRVDPVRGQESLETELQAFSVVAGSQSVQGQNYFCSVPQPAPGQGGREKQEGKALCERHGS